MSLAACSLTSTRVSKSSVKRSGKSYVISGKRYYILASAEGFREKGRASWYGEPFHGRKTANGETYDMNKLSAAHKTLPLNTWVEIRNLDNNKTLTVRVNDRGPFIDGRIIDLSRAAAEEIGMLRSGVAKVSLKAVTGRRARELSAMEDRVNAQVARKQGTAAKTAANRIPAPAAGGGDSGGKGYGVEVSGGSEPDRAKKLIASLKKEFTKVKLGSKYQNGAPQFFVYVDGLTKNAADSLKRNLTSRGYDQSRVLTR
jgi:rare lipoprotein A